MLRLRHPSCVAAILAIGASCVWAPARPPCVDDGNCPDGLACVDEVCTPQALVDPDAGPGAPPDGADAGPDGPTDAGFELADAGGEPGCVVVPGRTLGSAEQVLDFAPDGAACVIVEGNVFVVAGVESLALLGPVVEIRGDLQIEAAEDLQTLDGLETVVEIDGDLEILDSDDLFDVSALHDLDAVGGDVEIVGNLNLLQCEAHDLVDEIDHIDGIVIVEDNDLSDCGGG